MRRHFFSYPETRKTKSLDYGKFAHVVLLRRALKNGETKSAVIKWEKC